MKTSRSSQQHWGQADVVYGTGQELVSPPHYDKAFLIAVHGSMESDTSIRIYTGDLIRVIVEINADHNKCL